MICRYSTGINCIFNEENPQFYHCLSVCPLEQYLNILRKVEEIKKGKTGEAIDRWILDLNIMVRVLEDSK